MNVIISNKYSSMLQGLQIDIIKSLNGEFDVNDIIDQFQNFYFQRMVLDITALKDHSDIKTLQKLSISLDMDKIILLLDDSDPESGTPAYLSKLISMGIYNFTKNVEGIMYLYNNPNTYRDVAQFHQLEDVTIEQQVVDKFEPANGVRVIGVKNVTRQAGATSLIYMLKKQLERKYNVMAIEVDKSDFIYFRDKKMISVVNTEIGNTITKYNDSDIILVDVNTSDSAMSLCSDILYLVEPSMIKLNKLMTINPKAFKPLKNKKVLLNKSLVKPKDVLDFEYEAKVKIFYNLPPLDERELDIPVLNAFLIKLGFELEQSEEQIKKNKILGLFGG